MTLDQYFASLRAQTAIAYISTANYLKKWQENTANTGESFAEFLGKQKLAYNTCCKHIRQARIIDKRCNLGYQIEPLQPVTVVPPRFTDTDFQKLYAAFAHCQYLKFIASGERHRYWQTLVHFASVTAVRRQVILGINAEDVNFQEFYITVLPENDKKHQIRYKPITSELAADLLDLLRFYDLTAIPVE